MEMADAKVKADVERGRSREQDQWFVKSVKT